MKKKLSLVIALAMMLTCIPAFALTANAAVGSCVLFDAALIETGGHGDISLTDYGWLGDDGALFSSQWSADGTWNSGPWGKAGLVFRRTGPRQNGNDEKVSANISGSEITRGAQKVVIDYSFAAQETSDIYQRWHFTTRKMPVWMSAALTAPKRLLLWITAEPTFWLFGAYPSVSRRYVTAAAPV